MLEAMGKRANETALQLGSLGSEKKNQGLEKWLRS